MAYPASFKLVLLGVLFDADSWFEYHFFRIRPKSIVCIYYFHQITSTKRSCWQAQHYFSSFLENCWAAFISWYIFSRLCTPWINQDDYFKDWVKVRTILGTKRKKKKAAAGRRAMLSRFPRQKDFICWYLVLDGGITMHEFCTELKP